MLNIWSCADATILAEAMPQVRYTTPPNYEMSIISQYREKAKPEDQRLIAVVNLTGVLSPNGLLDGRMAGTPTRRVREVVRSLANDSRVLGVLFRVDSPGGSTMGTAELHDDILALSSKVPTVACVQGLACSAALFAIAGVRRIIATRGSIIGAIGTYSVVVDSSQMMERIGVKVIPITTSDLKVAGLFGTEVTEAQRASMQRLINSLQQSFTDAIRVGRRLSESQLQMVLSGEVWPARLALQRGLIDAIGDYDSALLELGKMQPLVPNVTTFVEHRQVVPAPKTLHVTRTGPESDSFNALVNNLLKE